MLKSFIRLIESWDLSLDLPAVTNCIKHNKSININLKRQNMADTSYIKIKDSYEPINAIPCGIKCLTCNHYYDPEEIQGHFSTHIETQYLKPVLNFNDSYKLKFQNDY